MENRVVFSALYNESDEFLPHFIKNFLRFTGPDEILLINLPPGRTFDLSLTHESGRVFLFNGTIIREKLGHTLLIGHIESFDYALRSLIEFSFFCPIASNSLFIRNFNFSHVLSDYHKPVNYRSSSIDDLPDHWWFKNVRQCNDFLDFIRDEMSLNKLSGGQIEGLFSCKENWKIVHENRSAILRSAELVHPDLNFPFEEIFPQSIFLQFGTGQMSLICHNFWGRSSGYYGNVTMKDILKPDVDDHIFLMKWFERSINNPQTFAVTDEWAGNLVQNVKLEIEKNRPVEKIRKMFFFDTLHDLFSQSFQFVPFTSAWQGITEGFSCEFEKYDVSVDQKIFEMETGYRTASGTPSTYLYFERTDDVIDIEIKLSYNNDLFVEVATNRISTSSVKGSPGPTLEGYLYISTLEKSRPSYFRLRFPPHASIDTETVMSRPVMCHNGIYRVVRFAHHAVIAGCHEYYIRNELVAPSDLDVWLGLPFYDNSKYGCFIDIIYDEP